LFVVVVCDSTPVPMKSIAAQPDSEFDFWSGVVDFSTTTLGFAYGVHQCIGANLARVEMQRYERATGHRVIVDDSVNFSVCAARKFYVRGEKIR
jgi:hypothetical protein